MNNQVLELLKQSSEEVRLTREKKDSQKAREEASMQRFINRSKNNAIDLFRYLLKKAIFEYVNDPISILNFDDLVHDKCYEISIAILSDSDLKSVPGRRLAQKYNGRIYSDSDKNRVSFYSQDYGNPIPVIIKDLYGCTLEGNSIKVKFSNEFIKRLTIQAHENKNQEDLNGRNDIYDQKTIELLKRAYDDVEAKAKEMNAYLESIRRNASMVYFHSYKRLLKEYRNNHKESELFVSINTKYNHSNCKASLFNSASKYDRIEDCSYFNENGEEVFVPVQISVLENMFEQDKNIGFKYFDCWGSNYIIAFDTALFEEELTQINKKEYSIKL